MDLLHELVDKPDDLIDPVNPQRDHQKGQGNRPVSLHWYKTFPDHRYKTCLDSQVRRHRHLAYRICHARSFPRYRVESEQSDCPVSLSPCLGLTETPQHQPRRWYPHVQKSGLHYGMDPKPRTRLLLEFDVSWSCQRGQRSPIRQKAEWLLADLVYMLVQPIHTVSRLRI